MWRKGRGEGIQFCPLAYLATTFLVCSLCPSLGLQVGRRGVEKGPAPCALVPLLSENKSRCGPSETDSETGKLRPGKIQTPVFDALCSWSRIHLREQMEEWYLLACVRELSLRTQGSVLTQRDHLGFQGPHLCLHSNCYFLDSSPFAHPGPPFPALPVHRPSQRVTGSDGSGAVQLLLPLYGGKVHSPSLLRLLSEEVEIAASVMARIKGLGLKLADWPQGVGDPLRQQKREPGPTGPLSKMECGLVLLPSQWASQLCWPRRA